MYCCRPAFVVDGGGNASFHGGITVSTGAKIWSRGLEVYKGGATVYRGGLYVSRDGATIQGGGSWNNMHDALTSVGLKSFFNVSQVAAFMYIGTAQPYTKEAFMLEKMGSPCKMAEPSFEAS